MTQIDLEKVRRENMRWTLLVVLNNSRPISALDTLMLQILSEVYQRVTATELHKQLGYLETGELVRIERRPDGHWLAGLTRLGIDVAEYTIDCPCGIARPEKYWS